MNRKKTNAAFSESGLIFEFAPGWRVVKYDEHRFFQGFSGVGLKGVDFLVLRPGEQLVLLEVKNLDQYPLQADWDTLGSELVDAVGQKVEDTLRGLDAIHRYYARQWWHSWRDRLARWGIAPVQDEWAFWWEATRLAAQPGNLSVIFWLECGKSPSGWPAGLQRQLREDLQPLTGNVLVTNSKDIPAPAGWRVRYR